MYLLNNQIVNKMKKLLLFVSVAVATFACTPSNTFTVNGTVADTTLNSQTVYLMDYSTNKQVDSTIITDGKFTFTGNADSMVIVRISAGRAYANILVEKGVIDVKLDSHSKISGTPLNNTLATYTAELDSISKSMSEWYKSLKEIGASETKIDSIFVEFNKTIADVNEKYFSSNATNSVGLFAAWNQCLTPDITVSQIDSLIAIVGVKAQNFGPIQNIRQALVNKELTGEGKMFVDFPGVSHDGTPVKLSDYVGKGNYTLVDFWGSWCGPCKAEMPNIKEVYELYSPKGLVVVGANVWDTKAGFDKAVVDLELPWVQICNFDNEVPTDTYGINGIPHIILFAPDGTIVSRDLRGDEMKKKLAEIYSAKK